MRRRKAVSADIRELAASWDLSVRALNRSPNTRAAYGESLRQLTDYFASNAMPTAADRMDRQHVEAFLADLAEQGKAPATVNKRYMALRGRLMCEDAATKGRRYVVEGRLHILLVHRDRIFAECKGDGSIWHPCFTRGSWHCDCPAGKAQRCAHLHAQRLVTAPNHRGGR